MLPQHFLSLTFLENNSIIMVSEVIELMKFSDTREQARKQTESQLNLISAKLLRMQLDTNSAKIRPPIKIKQFICFECGKLTENCICLPYLGALDISGGYDDFEEIDDSFGFLPNSKQAEEPVARQPETITKKPLVKSVVKVKGNDAMRDLIFGKPPEPEKPLTEAVDDIPW